MIKINEGRNELIIRYTKYIRINSTNPFYYLSYLRLIYDIVNMLEINIMQVILVAIYIRIDVIDT